MNKVAIVIGLAVVLLIGSIVYTQLKQKSDIPNEQKSDISKLPDYYRNLAKECESRASYSCCISSVNYMADGNYTLEPETGCPEGYQRNMLRCIDTFKWCEPVK